MEFDRYWHMAGIFRAAAKPSLVWGVPDLAGRYGTLPLETLNRHCVGTCCTVQGAAIPARRCVAIWQVLETLPSDPGFP